MSRKTLEVPRAAAATFAGTERFEVVGQLGEGGMGVVLEAFDRERKVRVALKTVRELDATSLLRFKDEFRVARDLLHPNVVRLGELVERAGRWLFTMELVRGQSIVRYARPGEVPSLDESQSVSTLAAETSVTAPSRPSETDTDATCSLSGVEARRLLSSARKASDAERKTGAQPVRAAPRFDEWRVRHVMAQLGQGIQALHAQGIIHRDIKPSNAIVTNEGRVVLIDFGLALTGYDSLSENCLVGTPAFMAPEQIDNPNVAAAADWYAFGGILYCLLVGEPPFKGSAAEILWSKLEGKVPDPDAFVSDIPPELSQLCRDLLAHDPDRRSSYEEIRERLHVVSGTSQRPLPRVPFIGREVELRMLEEALASTATSDHPVVVFLEGESGIGKSACAEELLRRAKTANTKTLVLRGRCHEREVVPYKAFDGIVDDLAGVLRQHPKWLPEDRNDLDKLAMIFPVLLGVAGFPQAEPGSNVGKDMRGPAFLALRRLLASIRRRVRVILVIDDAQWADADSLTLLETVFAADLRSPLFLLATARPAANDDPCDAWHAVQAHARRLRLQPLGAQEAQTLADHLLNSLSEKARERALEVASVGRGHPMYIAELARYLADDPGRGAEGLNLDVAIRGRIAKLSPSARKLIEVLAVAGVPIPHEAAQIVAGLRASEYADLSDLLVSQQLLGLTGHGQHDTVFPYHDRVREAVAEAIGDEARRELHATLGATLESTGAAAALVATFHHASGAFERAAFFATQAAEQSKRALAFDRAADFYEMAARGTTNDKERLHLLKELGFALQHAGRREQSALAYQEAANLTDDEERFALTCLAANQLLTGGFVSRGWKALEAFLPAMRVRMPTHSLWSGMGVAYHLLRLALHPLRWARRASYDGVRREIERDDFIHKLTLGVALIEPQHAFYFALLHSRLALAAGDPARVARGMASAASVASALGLGSLAQRFIDATAVAASQDGSPLSHFYEMAGQTFKAFFADHDWRRILELRVSALRFWNEAGLGNAYEVDLNDQFLTWALWNLGDFAELRNSVQRSLARARRGGNPFLSTSLRTYHNILFLIDDNPDGAERDLTEALAAWCPGETKFGLPEAWALFSEADIMLYRAQPERSVELEDKFHELSRTRLDAVSWVRARRAHTRTRLYLSLAERSSGPARRANLRAARRGLRSLGKQSLSARAWSALCEAALPYLETGDVMRSRELLRVAIEALREAHFSAYEDAARYRLAQLDEGPEAALARRRAREAMLRRGIVSPERMLRVLSPGWPDPPYEDVVPHEDVMPSERAPRELLSTKPPRSRSARNKTS